MDSPGAMALAATGSTELTEEVTAASATEMKIAGINWVYELFSDVSRFVNAVSQGLTNAGIAPSAKHFPGHGNTHVDSHLNLPVIMRNKEELEATELLPFKSLIDNQISTIMTGHMALPLITGDDTPCSLSHKITTQLLREEMKFGGVIVTDCLEMEAVAKKYGSEGGAVMSLEAGADVVMICHRMDRQRGAVEATYAAVQEGRLSVEGLRTSGERIAALKDKFARTSEPLDISEWESVKEKNAVLSKRVYAAAMSVISDPRGILPIQREDGPVLLFTPQMQSINPAVDDPESNLRDQEGRLRNTAGPSYYAFGAAIAQRAVAHHIVYTPEGNLQQSTVEYLQSASAIIFATRNGIDQGAWQMGYLRKLLEYSIPSQKKLVLVSTCAPYDVLGLNLEKEGAPTAAVCATMEFTVPALEAMTRVIFGEVKTKGLPPVRIV
ncbi:hypothetical protein EW026_g5596 [Hermanssonia centrifuga]|uniref:Glycoside hydrolase family 3 N-terminal domain-containing protein n=1 Tax=Hermanssonia centrifuga TaxID=98765 RepID=A0A4S4KFD6_9APHY|nr:hypothetical protein EW026_g5596 [Hermanssonia centrifuga]